MHRALLGQNGFFEDSFLEAPRVVQFHAIVIHCHHGMDADDTSIFVLGSELISYRFAPNSKFQSAREKRETHERVEL